MRQKRTTEELIKIANSCKSIKELRNNHPEAYQVICRNNILEDNKIFLISERNPITEEFIKNLALQHKYRSQFKQASPSAYRKARELGILDTVCSHMTPATRNSKKTRNIYAYEFEDKTAYVGLTYNIEIRHSSHLKDEKSQVFKKIITGVKYSLKILETDLIPSIASDKEIEWAKYYIDVGFVLLNKAKCGNLGGNHTKWTKIKILETASNYKYLSDFSKENCSAYTVASRNGWIDELELEKKKVDWTNEELAFRASKYKTISEFIKFDKNAYATAYNRKILNDICPHMKRRAKY
jgi:hypothetical protein